MDAEFRFDVELAVRDRDLDARPRQQRGVRDLLEGARTRYVDRLLGSAAADGGMVLANLEIEFRRPVTLGAGSVRIECGSLETGESSFRMGYRVYGDDDPPAATGESVQVARGGESSRPLPAEWREAFRASEPGPD